MNDKQKEYLRQIEKDRKEELKNIHHLLNLSLITVKVSKYI